MEQDPLPEGTKNSEVTKVKIQCFFVEIEEPSRSSITANMLHLSLW